ncbi:MAG: DUF4177 domain-containing protein [Litorimonas sp.]
MRYEYKVVTLKASAWGGKPEKRDANFESALNQLGMVGWNLVGVSPYGQNVQAFLKREK